MHQVLNDIDTLEMIAFPIQHFAGNDECGDNTLLAIALVISTVPC